MVQDALLAAVFSMAATLYAAPAGSQQSAVDWKYYSSSKNPKTGAALDLFYSSADIQRLTAEHVEVWVKVLYRSELRKAESSIDTNKPLLDRVAQKIASHYIPPVARLRSVDQDQAITITSFEEIANDAAIRAYMRVLYEIDCSSKQVRELSIVTTTATSDRERAWKHIPPESPVKDLSTLVCPNQ
jgi:hypothetical protein